MLAAHPLPPDRRAGMIQEKKFEVSSVLRPRKKPVQGRSRLKIEKILEGAQGVMREKGVRAVTTHAIAAAAGANVASIYQYFPNKEAIIQALYEQKLVSIRTRIVELSESLDLGDWRSAVYRLVFDVKHFEEEIGFDRTIIEATQHYPLLEDTWRAHADRTARTIRELIRRIGSPWSDKALHDLALYIYSLSNATWSYWRLRGAEHELGLHRQAVATVALFALAVESESELSFPPAKRARPAASRGRRGAAKKAAPPRRG